MLPENGEGRPESGPRNLASMDDSARRRRPPRLELLAEIEELPRFRLYAESFEDQRRLLCWLDHPAVRARLRDVLDDALDGLAEVA